MRPIKCKGCNPALIEEELESHQCASKDDFEFLIFDWGETWVSDGRKWYPLKLHHTILNTPILHTQTVQCLVM